MELKKNYLLTNTSVDEISEEITAFLEELKMERKNQLRIRLLVEEILLDWQERFSQEAVCVVKLWKRLGRPFISIETEGEAYNPLEEETENYGTYRNRLLANMGLSPVYTYEHGRNRMLFRLKKEKKNPLIGLGTAVLAALITGIGGMYLPDALRCMILEDILIPIYDTFFNLLGTIAGPMVFLSVTWGIYGIGDTATFGRIGKKMIFRFICAVFLICIAFSFLVLPFFSLNLVWKSGGISQLNSLYQMVLGFVPADIITPFQEGNSMQIIFLAVAFAVALLVLGKQTESVAHAIEQMNYIVQFLMEIISTFIPFFIFIVLVQMIWSDTLEVVLAAWRPLVIFLAGVAVLFVVWTCLAAFRGKTGPIHIMKKGLPVFVIGVTTASSVASFGTCMNTCEKKMGVKNSITSFGIPLGIVMFPPAAAMYFIIICIYTAEVYGVECSLTWLVLAVFTSVVLSIASPPIPGGALTCYTILFMQLGLPEEALVVALALDVLCDFVATGVDMYCLQMELVIQAKKMHLLNEKILQKEN